MKTLRNYLIPTLFVLCIQLSASGQKDSLQTAAYKHNLGFGVGHTTGLGLSYRYHPSKFGIQTNLGGNKDDYGSDFNVGVTFIYSLFINQYTNFYLYQGNSYRYEFDKFDYNGYNTQSKESQFVNNGVGIGLELIALKHISFNGMVGYGARENFKEIQVVGEMAIYYKF